ncbi:fructose-bisphosphatase class II family protein [Leifsonia sp. YAF41]|uniref:fructose-bisphosphatase class II family protein n=1 Tax=Leifsonia sp. YAF41 TaxID=3233086 RepID=UPI003F9A47F7
MLPLTLTDDLLQQILGVTGAAALAATPLVGAGDRNAVDGAAVAGMRQAFSRVPIDGVIVVGEGEKDEAPLLHTGERVGTGAGPRVDVAVDPVDGTRLAAENRPGAIAVMSVAPRGSLFDPGPVFYLDKFVTSGAAAGLRLDAPTVDTLHELAARLDRSVTSLRVAIQDRPRNQAYVDAVRSVGASVVSFRDGDVIPALHAAHPRGSIDLLLGIGGAPEGVLTAVAVRALGGIMQARRSPQTPAERGRTHAAGLSTVEVLELADLAAADGYFFLTAVTDVEGLRELGVDDLPGVRRLATGSETVSLLVSPGGGIRRQADVHKRAADADPAGPGRPATRE